MRNNIAFRLTAQNSLKINQITHKEQKSLINTFKAGSDLRTQLNKVKVAPKSIKVGGTTDEFLKQQIKADEQILVQQVAALDHFKAPVTREKTKNMIQNIKLRRRQKHIDALGRFREDADEFRQALLNSYQSLVNDIDQVMGIKLTNIEEYLKNCNQKQYLLSRQKQLVSEIQQQFMNYRVQCQTKLGFGREELNRIKKDRSESATQLCHNLSDALVQIAFILQPEVKQVEKKQRQELQKFEQSKFNEYSKKLETVIQEQANRNKKIEQLSNDVISKWRTEKQEYQLNRYTQDVESDTYRRNKELREGFSKLIEEQAQNHDRKVKFLSSLIRQNPDTLSKANIDKFNQAMKKINDHFDNSLDQLMVVFKDANTKNKQLNEMRLNSCKSRLKYIEKHNEEQIQKIMQQKCEPLFKRNIDEQEQLIKKATQYAQEQDQRENKVIEYFVKFILKIASENDSFIKQFTNLNQKYEMEKAKILDEDDEAVQKLNQQLNALKMELKEALHHIKLQEVEKKCFDKVDEIENAYRQCHSKNKSLQQTRKPSLEQFMKKYQAKLAEILQLFDPSRRAQLQQKNKKQCEEEALRRIQKQEKKKAEEQQRLIQEAKAKGGKPPPPAKPKDPKKAAAELEERKKAVLAQIGTKKIEEIKTQTGSTWLVFRNITQICQSFYRQANKQLMSKKGDTNEEVKNEDIPKALDAIPEAHKDCRNSPVVNQHSFIQLKEIIPLVQSFRTQIFDAVSKKKMRILGQSQKLDEQMMEQSLINLDNRLKAHYSLKGKIQSQIFVKRSGEISGHKKKYEKYARTIKEKVDLQTEKFNFLLQKGLQSLKNHIAQQKGLKQAIPKCKNLSELQGMFSKARQNYNTFTLNMKQIYNELDRFSNYEISTLLKRNEDFIKQSKLMKDGGDYSQQQIAWYEQMMSQITKQMKDQQQKRQQKFTQLKDHSEKRKQQLLQQFQKQYNLSVEETAAKDGTGKKYGRPKRIAQEKTRLQMNKCEQAQININNMINDVYKQYEKMAKSNFSQKDFPELLAWRKKLMTIQFCIIRYSKHIEAIKTDLKIAAMVRVNYNLKNPDPKLASEQEEQDKKRKEQELRALGKLGDQKDDKIFAKYVQQIEKLISDESRTIYVGDKAKYLTGNDKIPDFLRLYIANMKKSCESFRFSCIRDLRQSCLKFSDLSANIAQLFYNSLLSYFMNKQSSFKQNTNSQFSQFSEKHKKMRIQNTKRLRPNLSNPKCQQELKQLDKKEKDRNQDYIKNIQVISVEFKDGLFKIGQEFLSCLLNNYEFLLVLSDAFYLNEDFVKVPGDQIEDKEHLQTQKLLVMKQKGIKIDPTSERNIRKKWDGLDYSICNIEARKYEIKKSEEVPKQKDKKGGKKDSKDPKKQQDAPQQSDPNKSKTIETFKTWRQKAIFQGRERVKTSFKSSFDQILTEINQKIQIDSKQNAVHSAKWRQIADSLYIK